MGFLFHKDCIFKISLCSIAHYKFKEINFIKVNFNKKMLFLSYIWPTD